MKSITLLCIDDDPDDIELLREAIETINPNVCCHCVNSGKHGLELLNSISPEFIFLDINMPVMDGHETLQAIRANYAFNEIPICILSTTVRHTDKEALLKMGANYCIQKATTFAELCSRLKSVFRVRAPQ